MKRQLALLGALMLACGTVGSVHAADPAPQVVSTNAGTVIVKGTVVDENG